MTLRCWQSSANPRAVQLVSPCSLHFHSRRFQQEARVWHSLCVLCSSVRASTRKQHLKLFSDLLLSLQLYPCHWITQSYWTSERPAEVFRSHHVPLCLRHNSFSLPSHVWVSHSDALSSTEYLELSEQLFLNVSFPLTLQRGWHSSVHLPHSCSLPDLIPN